MRYGCVEHQAVAVHDGCRHAVMDGAWRGLPGQSPPVPVQLQSVGEVLGLLAGANEQDDGKELLVALVLLLFLQHQHEVMAETGLHHHPVHGPWQVNVCGQKDDVFPLEGGDALMGVHEMGHHGFQGPLPLAGSARTRAGVGTVFTDVFVFWFLRVVQGQGTARGGILAGKQDCRGHLLHSQVPDAGRQGAPARRAAAQLLAALVTHQVPGLALQDWGQDIVKADRALKERGQLVVLRGHRASPAGDGACWGCGGGCLLQGLLALGPVEDGRLIAL